MNPTNKNTPIKFWRRVAEAPSECCWEWQGATAAGYGKLGWNGKVISAHRLAYTLSKGEILQGNCILHSCNNPLCCNPQHLSQGSVKENNRQRAKEGRSNQDRQLTAEETKLLKELKDSGCSFAEAAGRTSWTHRALHKHWKSL